MEAYDGTVRRCIETLCMCELLKVSIYRGRGLTKVGVLYRIFTKIGVGEANTLAQQIEAL